MELNNQNTLQTEKKNHIFSKLSGNIKSLEKYEWAILIFQFMLGTCTFLAGFTIIKQNFIFGYALEGFAILVTMESITSTFNIFIVNKENDRRMRNNLSENKEAIIKEVILIMEKYKEDTADLTARKMMHIEKIKELGYVDILPVLDLHKALGEINNSTTLFLQRLYFSPKDFKELKGSISDLIINKNCIVKILLSSPWETLILEKRRENSPAYKKALHLRLEIIINNIIVQLLRLFEIMESLPEDKKKNLQIKIHDHYTIGPITGYNDIIIYGHYLNDEIADEAMQHKCKGRDTAGYLRMKTQFKTSWENAKCVTKEEIDDYIAKREAK